MRFKQIHIHTTKDSATKDAENYQALKAREQGIKNKIERAQAAGDKAELKNLEAEWKEVHRLMRVAMGISDASAQDASRLVDTIRDGSFYCKIYYDSDLEEYCCKLYEGGIYHAEADYFTDDKSDAQSSARDMVRRLKASTARDSAKGQELLAKYEKELADLNDEIEAKEDKGVTVPPEMLERRKKLNEQIKGARTMDATPAENAKIRKIRDALYDAVRVAADLSSNAQTPFVKTQAQAVERLIDQARRIMFDLQD